MEPLRVEVGQVSYSDGFVPEITVYEPTKSNIGPRIFKAESTRFPSEEEAIAAGKDFVPGLLERYWPGVEYQLIEPS